MGTCRAQIGLRGHERRLSRSLLVSTFVAAGLLLAPVAADAGSLVVPAEGLKSLGLRPVSASAAAARDELESGLTQAARRAIANAPVQVAGAAEAGERLLSAAFKLPSSKAAQSVLALWRKREKSKAATVGQDGMLLVRGKAVTVAWREGALIGTLRLSAPRSEPQLALELARLGDDRLRTGPPKTAWERITEQISPTGQMPVSAALQALALVGGPLPGVHVPAGARPALVDGTGATLPILQYLPGLKGRLRAAVLARLGIDYSGRSARAADLGDPAFHPSSYLTTIANKWAAVYAQPSRIGVPLAKTIVAGTSANSTPLADTAVFDANGNWVGPGGPICRIRALPSDLSLPAGSIEFIMAHEVFHCFEFQLGYPRGGWMIEGMAEWAASEVDPAAQPSAITAARFQRQYLETQSTPLFKRTYDATGYWGHAQETVPGGLWPHIKEVLTAPNPQDAVIAAGGESAPFMDTWGSSIFRLDGVVPAWNIIDPVQISTGQVPARITEIDANQFVIAQALTTNQYAIGASPGKPIVHVTISGYARLDSKHNYTDLENAAFCQGRASSCQCPPGSPAVAPLRPLSPAAALALSSDLSKTTVGRVRYLSLDEYCHLSSPPTAGPPRGQGGGAGELPERSCATVLPSAYVPMTWESNTTALREVALYIQHIEEAGRRAQASECAFENVEGVPPETELKSLVTVGVYRYPSIAGAIEATGGGGGGNTAKTFEALRAKALAFVHLPGIGEEAIALDYHQAANGECWAEGVVRVSNLVANMDLKESYKGTCFQDVQTFIGDMASRL
jgi:hypothetical protein